MKKIIYIFIFSILLIFTFSNNSQASNGERYLYERINLVWNENVWRVSLEEEPTRLRLRFIIKNDLFVNYKYMFDDSRNNMFLILKDIESGTYNDLVIDFSNPIYYGNEIAVSFIIPKDYFIFYIEEVLQIDEADFYYHFDEYLEDGLIDYFHFYFRVDEETIAGTEYHHGYNIGYNEGYAQGLQVSQSEAYEQGYQDGANESFLGSIDKWIVPSIIIVMLAGGFFAIARKKRDGDI